MSIIIRKTILLVVTMCSSLFSAIFSLNKTHGRKSLDVDYNQWTSTISLVHLVASLVLGHRILEYSRPIFSVNFKQTAIHTYGGTGSVLITYYVLSNAYIYTFLFVKRVPEVIIYTDMLIYLHHHGCRVLQ